MIVKKGDIVAANRPICQHIHKNDEFEVVDITKAIPGLEIEKIVLIYCGHIYSYPTIWFTKIEGFTEC